MQSHDAHQDELLCDGLDGAGDVFVEGGVAGLEDGSVVLFASDEEVRGVDLADIEDGVYGDLDWIMCARLLSVTQGRVWGAH